MPTIGIGAGPACDGQILVLDDILGLTRGPVPKFVKTYAQLGGQTAEAVRQFKQEVREKKYPQDSPSSAAEPGPRDPRLSKGLS